MENISLKTYNSKYSNISYDEYKKIRNSKHIEWYNGLSEEQRNKYKNPLSTHGYCEVCGKNCSNIYSHKKSRKHLNNIKI